MQRRHHRPSPPISITAGQRHFRSLLLRHGRQLLLGQTRERLLVIAQIELGADQQERVLGQWCLISGCHLVCMFSIMCEMMEKQMRKTSVCGYDSGRRRS